MCGRKTLTKDKTEIINEYLSGESNAKFDWQPSYNIAPSQTTPILVQNSERKTDNTGKQPYYIFRDNHEFMPMAGLWSQWQSKNGEIINSYTVITTEPAEKIAHIHNRMPAIITRDNLQTWLNYEKFTPEKAVGALKPYREKLNYYPVSKYMNSQKNNSPKCIEKYTAKNLSLF